MTASIPLWLALIVPTCTFVFGFLICAALTVGRNADGGEG